MKTVKETSPSVVVKVDDNVYYASAIPTFAPGGIIFEYDRNRYKVCNYDEVEYELIHWLSGTDALVNGVWRDRVAIDGELNFVNHNCTWNDTHDGYYSADGSNQYFQTATNPTLDFGTDWYMEVVASTSKPIGTTCFIVDFSALGTTDIGVGIQIRNMSDGNYIPGQMYATVKGGNNNGVSAFSGDNIYSWNEKSLFVAGVNRYSVNQSRAFLEFDGNKHYGVPFNTLQWKNWPQYFYLFRGYLSNWVDSSFNIVGRCGPTTIYDIKIWRKK